MFIKYKKFFQSSHILRLQFAQIIIITIYTKNIEWHQELNYFNIDSKTI